MKMDEDPIDNELELQKRAKLYHDEIQMLKGKINKIKEE